MSEENISGKDLVRLLKLNVEYINYVIRDLKKVSELNRYTSLMIARGKGNILSSLVDVKGRVDKKVAQLEKLEPNQLLTDKELLDACFDLEVELRERGERV